MSWFGLPELFAFLLAFTWMCSQEEAASDQKQDAGAALVR